MATIKTLAKDKAAPHIALSAVLEGNAASVIQSLLCSTDYGILMTDHHGTDILCNPRFGELFDIDPEMVVRLSRHEMRRIAMARVKDPEEFNSLLERIYADPMLEMEDEIVLNTKPQRVLRRYTGPVLDSTGANIGRVWTFRDVTETRRLQAAVQDYATKLEAQFRAQADELEITTCVMNTIVAISAQIASRSDPPELVSRITKLISPLLGQKAVALLVPDLKGNLTGFISRHGRKCTKLVISEDEDSAVVSAMVAARSTDLGIKLQMDHDGPLARKMGVEVVALAGLHWLSTPLGVLAFSSDDETVLADEGHRPHLEAVVTHVALALRVYLGRTQLQSAYDELTTAQEQVVESAKLGAVGVLAAAIAHDIRNIMTPLQLDLGTARQLHATDSNISSAQAQLERLSALTHRLLSLTRPGTIHAGPICIRELISHVLPMIRVQAEIDNITIRTCFAAELPRVIGDNVRLEHMCINLFLNALNAMQSSGGALSIVASTEDSGVRIDIKDTGRGISEADLPRVFDAFFTTRANGTGLGLFSVKRIVDEHSGRIEVKSRVGKGTRFSVWLPACDSSSPGG